MPRAFGRSYPDADQVAMVNGTILNQSRVTFSGQRGLVIIFWGMSFQNEAAVLKIDVGVNNLGTAPLVGFFSNSGIMPGNINERLTLSAMLAVLDPPVGSFLEFSLRLSVGTLRMTQDDGFISGFSFGHSAEEGPTVTVQ